MQKAANEKFLSTKKGKIIVSSVVVGLIAGIAVLLIFMLGGGKSLNKAYLEGLKREADKIVPAETETLDKAKATTKHSDLKKAFNTEEIKTIIEKFNKSNTDKKVKELETKITTITNALEAIKTEIDKPGDFNAGNVKTKLQELKTVVMKFLNDVKTDSQVEATL